MSHSYSDLADLIAKARSAAASKLPGQTFDVGYVSGVLSTIDLASAATQAFVLAATAKAAGTPAAAQLQALADTIVKVTQQQLAPYSLATTAMVAAGQPFVTFAPPIHSADDVPALSRENMIGQGLPAAKDLRGVVLYLLGKYKEAIDAARYLMNVMSASPIELLFNAFARLLDAILNVLSAVAKVLPFLVYGAAGAGAVLLAYWLIKFLRSDKDERRAKRARRMITAPSG